MGCSASVGLSVTPEQGEGILISNSQPVILKSNRAALITGSETLIGTPAVEEVRDAKSIPHNGGKSCRVVPESSKTDLEIDGRTCNRGNDMVKKEQLKDQDINALDHKVHESGLLHRELKDIVNPMNMIAAIKRGDIETVKRIAAPILSNAKATEPKNKALKTKEIYNSFFIILKPHQLKPSLYAQNERNFCSDLPF